MLHNPSLGCCSCCWSVTKSYLTPWTTACQALLFSTISRSLLKFMSFESMMLSNHHMLYCLLLLCLWSFPASESFLVSQLSVSSGHCIGTSTSTSVLPMNIQCWFPLGLTGLISLLSKRFSRVFSSTILKHRFFGAQPSLWSNSYELIHNIHTQLLEKP